MLGLDSLTGCCWAIKQTKISQTNKPNIDDLLPGDLLGDDEQVIRAEKTQSISAFAIDEMSIVARSILQLQIFRHITRFKHIKIKPWSMRLNSSMSWIHIIISCTF